MDVVFESLLHYTVGMTMTMNFRPHTYSADIFFPHLILCQFFGWKTLKLPQILLQTYKLICQEYD